MIFLYGTLMDGHVFRRVIGRPPHGERQTRAILVGYRRVRVLGQAYPTLVRDPGAAVEGVAAHLLSHAEMARVGAYEGAGYVMRRLPVRLIEPAARAAPAFAWVNLPAAPARPDPRPWEPARWAIEEKPAFLRRLVCLADGSFRFVGRKH